MNVGIDSLSKAPFGHAIAFHIESESLQTLLKAPICGMIRESEARYADLSCKWVPQID